MSEILNTQNLLFIISIIIYGIVFFIQKSQFQKQESILEKYEKIFSIINIDEIEKYVELQKKSTELSFKNRLAAISHLESELQNKSINIEEILNTSSSNLEKSNEINNRVGKILEHNKNFTNKIFDLCIEEFDEICQILYTLNGINPTEFEKISSKILQTAKKYAGLKRALLEKM